MSQYKETTAEEIQHLVRVLETASAVMTSQARPEDVAIFLGTTKAGKSTLINFMLGNELIGERPQPWLPISIRKTGDYGPAIGGGSTSETVVPTRWDNVRRLPGLVLWDAPGFDDNRGPVQDITNAYYIYELFKSIKSIRIVLVVDVNDVFNDRINTFLALLNSVENLLRKKMSDCFTSIVVAFSKVPNEFQGIPVDMQLIINYLKHKVLDNPALDISSAGRDFVRHLLQNPRQIGLLKLASDGRIGDEIDQGVSTAILNAESVSSDALKSVVCPSLADRSQNFLYKARRCLSSMKSFQELIDVVKTVFQEKLHSYSQMQDEANQLPTVKAELTVLLNEINKVLEPNNSFQRKINLLMTIDRRIENKVLADGLLERSKLMQFVDRLLDLQESQEFDICVNSILCSGQSDVEKLILAIEMKLGEISQKEYEKKLNDVQSNYNETIKRLESQMAEVKSHNKERGKKLGAFGQLGDKIDKTIDTCAKAIGDAFEGFVGWFKK